MASVTVIVPALNAMPFLSEALSSLRDQVFTDFEILLWDNGSTDGTLEEASLWIPSKIPGRIVADQPLPLHLCLAKMVELADSTFIARMDADDIAHPFRLCHQISFLRNNPDVALVGGQIYCIDDQGNLLPNDDWAHYAIHHSDIVTRMMVWGPFNHPSITFRRSDIIGIGNYAFPAPVEDHNLYLRLVQSCRVANLSSVTTYYRIHSSSICSLAKSDNLHQRLVRSQTLAASQSVFHLDADTYELLQNRRHPVCIVPMLRSAIRRSSHERTTVLSIVLSRHFVITTRYLLARRDYISRVILRVIDAFVFLFRPPSSAVRDLGPSA